MFTSIVDETDQISKARKLVGLSQKRLAWRLGINPQTLSFYELGYRPVPLGVACRIAEEVGQPLDQLFGVVSHAA